MKKSLIIGCIGILAFGCGQAPPPATPAPEMAQGETPPPPPNPLIDDQGWETKWSVQNSGKELTVKPSFAGAEEYPPEGKSLILMVHPLNEQTPCVLSRKFKVAATGGAALVFAAASNAAKPEVADVAVSVKVDGQPVANEVVAAAAGWKEFNLDLAAHAGKEITVEIVVAAGGKSAWEWEHCFLADFKTAGLEGALAITNLSNDWNQKWVVTHSGKEILFQENFAGAEDYPHPGRKWILQLHPESEKVPCVMTREVAVPATGKPALVFAASADAAQLNGADALVKVRVDGKPQLEDVLRAGREKSAAGWKDYRIDLAPFAGRTVKVEIEAAAGGDAAWAWEFVYLADVSVQGVD